MFLYSADAWTVLRADAAILVEFAREVLRKILNSVRSNNKRHELLNNTLDAVVGEEDGITK